MQTETTTLIIENNPVRRESLAGLIETFIPSSEIQSAQSAEEAVQIVRGRKENPHRGIWLAEFDRGEQYELIIQEILKLQPEPFIITMLCDYPENFETGSNYWVTYDKISYYLPYFIYAIYPELLIGQTIQHP